MKIFDVTVAISKDLPVYPGDPPIKIERKKPARTGGDSKYSLSRLSMGSHTGTHIDPPRHLIDDGMTVDQIPLEFLVGPARVVEIAAPVIDEAVLREFDLAATIRLLFKTRNSYLWNQTAFAPDFVYLTPGAARSLVQQGIKVVGIDYLSVDRFEADELEVHKTLLEAGTFIIEGLDLRDVDPGDYEMICLPLKIKDGDGAPARVVLRQ
ncbi:MAG TPA: cyclase family protein [Blastocatellia bacterium]|nr:cyclase family protein [Blastocatellia bacterium]